MVRKSTQPKETKPVGKSASTSRSKFYITTERGRPRATLTDNAQDPPSTETSVAVSQEIKDNLNTPIEDVTKQNLVVEDTIDTVDISVKAETVIEKDEKCAYFIHISNLVRPFMLGDLHDLLHTFGEYDNNDFWIDPLRSNCYVKFYKTSSSQKAIEQLNGIYWPNHNKKQLVVEISNITQLPPVLSNSHSNSTSNPNKISEITVNFPVAEEVKDVEELKPVALSELFKKTECEPHIYWLPINNDI